MQIEVDQRQYVWAGLLVTGDLTRHVKGWLFFTIYVPFAESLPQVQVLHCGRGVWEPT